MRHFCQAELDVMMKNCDTTLHSSHASTLCSLANDDLKVSQPLHRHAHHSC